jgi:hypothetical protein
MTKLGKPCRPNAQRSSRKDDIEPRPKMIDSYAIGVELIDLSSRVFAGACWDKVLVEGS